MHLKFIMGLVILLLHTSAATTGLVVLGDDRRTDTLNLFLFFFDLLGVSLWIRIQPRLAILDGLSDLILCQAALVVGDGNLLTLTCAFVLGCNIQNTVGIDLERHLNLRLATRSRRDSTKVELAKKVVVLGHWALTLKNLNVDCRLVVLVS